MIVIVDYGLGNLGSVKNTLYKLGISSMISKSKGDIEKADALILPGVGSAKQGMENLKIYGLDTVLKSEINKGKPFLGICLGMQLLFSESEEGNVKCFDVVNGKVKMFSDKLKIPQIGWNEVRISSFVKASEDKQKLFEGIPSKSSFYFVNSFYCLPDDKSVIIGETEYGINYCSVLIKKNITATQFHPEKSGEIGQQFIKNWVKLI